VGVDRHLIAVLVLPVFGCPAPDPQGGLPKAPLDSALDYNEFVCNVQPTLVKRCSYLGCHGNEQHALRIYSVGKLREGMPTTRAQRSETKLTAEEVRLNFESATGVANGGSERERAAGAPAHIPILNKPLAARLGGGEHRGVAIFPVYPALTVDNDPEYGALTAWVAGKKQPSPVDPACAQLFAAMGLPPVGP
jgi:hypothetical protein